jgi:hypothetical protein
MGTDVGVGWFGWSEHMEQEVLHLTISAGGGKYKYKVQLLLVYYVE